MATNLPKQLLSEVGIIARLPIKIVVSTGYLYYFTWFKLK